MKRFSHLFLETFTHTTIGEEPSEGRAPEVAWIPHVDIYEVPCAILVVAELPGVKRDDIEVGVVGDRLRISGIRPKMIPGNTQRVLQMEIPYGPFARELRLPHSADIGHIEASYEEGCLWVRIPRTAC
jgi:HSP20 family protein